MFEVQNWGRISYCKAGERQKTLVDERIADKISDTLVFCEHDPVITLGRAAQREDESVSLKPEIKQALGTSIEVISIERGGMATYHGPGQIVAYPIFKMGKGGVLQLIRSLESWVVDFLKSAGLDAGVIEGKTGVWVAGERKIASIGIAARHWVSYHGLALNLSTGPDPWKLINPCGFDSSVMTDLKQELPHFDASYENVFGVLKESAEKYF